ncbi:MAG: hypothetical protein JRG67_14180 [Deltaproteobacteria bacterium]|nr:hypothetical protein [Deltaproteobacteria bacterium]
MVRFPQSLPLTLAPVQRNTGDNHCDETAHRQNRTHGKRSDQTRRRTGLPGTPNRVHPCPPHHRKTNTGSSSGDADPDFRSPHTKLHLVFYMSNVEGVRFEDLREGQRVSFDEGQGRGEEAFVACPALG